MKKPIFCIPSGSKATLFAKNCLSKWEYETTGDPACATHLLLPVPTPPDQIPESIGPGQTLIGGNLPELPYPHIDLLKDEYYLQENAAITAQCAVELAQERLSISNCPVLVIGWGRIGKCLASRLRLMNARVTVSSRKEKTLRQLRDLGFDTLQLPGNTLRFSLIFNTAPAPVMDAAKTNALCIDLASRKGIAGDNVLWARGLPGKMAPEASGALIAKTALRYALRKE